MREACSASKRSKCRWYYCNKPGHFNRYCWKRKHDLKSGQTKSRHANVAEGSEGEAAGDFAFVASQNQSTESTTWYFDSSASRHYTCHRDWYVNFIEIRVIVNLFL